MAFEGTFSECLARMHSKFRDYGEFLIEENRIVVKGIAAAIERDAAMLSPKGKTRQLAEGITHQVEESKEDGIVGMVGVPKSHPAGEYVAFVVFGTGRRGAASGVKVPKTYSHPKYKSYNLDWAGMSANPFLYEALAMNKENFRKRMKEAHRRAAERAKEAK